MDQVKEEKTSDDVGRGKASEAPDTREGLSGDKAEGWRVTMVVEARSPEMFKWGMEQAFSMGSALWIGVEISHKDDKTARVKVRTTKLRKPKSIT